MKPEEDVLAALKALAESDRELEAPPSVEVKLRAAFRDRRDRTRRRKLFAAIAIPAMAAAAALAVMLAGARRTVKTPPHTASSIERPVAPDVRVAAAQTERVATSVVRRHESSINSGGSARAVNAHAARLRQPREIDTDFFPLIDSLQAVDSGELVRVSLPASAMRDVGLPVREDRLSDRVQADVLVSNGMATAIRFVNFTQ